MSRIIAAGASATQIVSAFYREGLGLIETMLKTMLKTTAAWMQRHGFSEVDRFRGRMNREVRSHGAAYDRVQFMGRTLENIV